MDSSESGYSRRAFLGTTLAGAAFERQTASAADARSGIDLRQLIARADLTYDKPVARSEEGIPIGNGRMGTLVWTTPTELRFQINRADVYANNSSSNSFFERNTDYCGGCGFVEIDFGAAGDEPFPAAGFPQHLSVYDGLLNIQGKGVTVSLLAWPAGDVMAIEIEDHRTDAPPVDVNLRMLRYASQYFGGKLEEFAREHIVTVQTRSHTAASQLLIEGDRILLTQEFREGEYYDKSAVAIGIVGTKGRPRIANET
jgi:hypothetical protein